MGSLALRPDDSLAILTMVLSIGFRNSVSFLSAIQATELLTFAPVGLPPTEHASLYWTHSNASDSPHRWGTACGPTPTSVGGRDRDRQSEWLQESVAGRCSRSIPPHRQ